MIDVRKVKTLGRLLLKMETRGRAGSRKRLIFLMFSYLIPGCFLPLLLVKQNTDPTGFEFTFLTYLFYTLIISFTISSELDNLLVTQTEAEIFNALPVDDKLLARAKMYMLNRYLLILTIPLFVPGAVFYYTMMKSASRSIMYFAAGYLLCYFTVNLLLLIYSAALRIFKSKKLSTYTLLFQVLLILLMIIGYQLVSYGISGKQPAGAVNYLHLLQKKNLIDILPPAWYAFLCARSQYELGISLILKLILPFLICYLSYLSLIMYLEENLTIIKEKMFYAGFSQGNDLKDNKASGPFANFIESVYLRNSAERSSFSLMKSMFSQDKAMKLNIIPMIIIPTGLTIFALITSQLPPPFENMFFAVKPVFHISIMISVLVVLNTALLGVKLTNHSGASWIYESYPMEAKKRFKNGIRKFFIVYLLIPTSIILAIIFAFKMPLWQASLHTLFIFAAANLYNSFYNLLSKALPFTKENTLLNSAQKLTNMVFPLVFGTLIVFVQLFVYSSVPHSIIALLIILTLNFWVNFFGFVHVKSS